jgi:hypothetical protein
MFLLAYSLLGAPGIRANMTNILGYESEKTNLMKLYKNFIVEGAMALLNLGVCAHRMERQDKTAAYGVLSCLCGEGA